MYREDEKFADSRDCPNCHRLLGQKIARIWQSFPDGTGLSIQWECESCHCRSFEYVEFAECAAAENLGTCEYCAEKKPAIVFYMSSAICPECLKIVREFSQEGGGE
jgi:hypothetical protein